MTEDFDMKAGGGYANRNRADKFVNNNARECVWFSPFTIKPDRGLFEDSQAEGGDS